MKKTLLLFLVLVLSSGPVWAKLPTTDPVQLFKAYLRINTTNPPGNEMRAVRFWKRFFDGQGISAEVFSMRLGRGNIVARVPGSGKKRPIILLNHLDVVPAVAARWKHPPFAAQEVDGVIFGRGALDMKGTAVCQAMALVRAHKEKWALDRDLIFLGTADEETGTEDGARWMLEHHREILDKAEFVWTEGQTILMKDGETVAWNLATTEKKRVELTLVAYGTAGHPADLNPDAAVPKLLRALDRIAAFTPPTHVIPSVDHYFKQMAARVPPEDREKYNDIRKALDDPAFEKKILADPVFAPLLRTTYAITLLSAGEKSNIVPGQASAVLDFRMLPGEDPPQLFGELKKAVGDHDVEFRFGPAEPATESSLNTDFYRAILKARDQYEPGVPLLTPPLTSATDAPAFRGRGITVYGFEPYHLAEEDDQSHGDNERLSRENLLKAISITQFVVKELAKSAP